MTAEHQHALLAHVRSLLRQHRQAPKTTALQGHIVRIVTEMHPLGVRGVAYQLLVRHILPSMADNETKRVSRLLVQAREDGMVPWAHIVDESRQYEDPFVFRGVAEYADVLARSYRRDPWATQPYRVHLWSEKNIAGGLLRPILQQYAVPFLNVHGFASASTLHKAAEQSTETTKETVILYVGDHDPSGMLMSEVDLPDRLTRYGGRVTIRRIALVEEDLAALPSISAKQKDSRFSWYYQRYGARAWELDAMNPNVLRRRTEAAIKDYIDQKAWDRLQRIEAAERQKLRAVLATLRENGTSPNVRKRK